MVNPVSEYELLLSHAQLGDEARRFLKSNLGKFLIERISSQEKQALNQLRTVDPYDAKAVQKCQNEIAIAVMSKNFLIEAMIMGDNATMRLEALEDSDFPEGYDEEDPQMGGLDGFTDEQYNGEEE